VVAWSRCLMLASTPARHTWVRQLLRCSLMEYALISTYNCDANQVIKDVSASMDFLVLGIKVALEKVAR
jgi:hypothetical protein